MQDFSIPALPINTKEMDICLLISSFGVNDKLVSSLLNKYADEAINLTDLDGVSLITRAIQMNDGEAVSFFLEKGQDVNKTISPNSSKTIFEYAKEISTYNDREPYAWNAIKSFKDLHDNCPLQIMSHTELRNLQVPKYQGETVKLFHGTKSSTSEDALTFISQKIANIGVKEISNTPTLSTVPIGQFFSPGSLGFSYEIPKKLIAFDDEKNSNAIIWIDTKNNIARIINEHKCLPFAEFKAQAIYRPLFISKEVYPTYGSTKGAFSRVSSTLNPAQIELMKKIKGQVENHTPNDNSSITFLDNIDKIRRKNTGVTTSGHRLI